MEEGRARGRARLAGVSADHGHHALDPATVRFCPLCSAPLGRESVPPDYREQWVCTRCRFVFYLNPKLVAATIPEDVP